MMLLTGEIPQLHCCYTLLGYMKWGASLNAPDSVGSFMYFLQLGAQ